MKRIVCLSAVLTAVVFTPHAAELRSTEIDALLRTAVEQKRVPMVVAMAADARGVFYEHAIGARKDAIFAIASMTKPVTSVAAMQLVEAGRVKLDAPAATYVPELGTVRVLDGGAQRPPRTPITVRHLLSHTSGFGYEFMNRELFSLVAKKEIPSAMAGGDAFLKAPLVFDPGARWEYGISTDWLGKLVERVSGQSLAVYFQDHIFKPLGMVDSFYNVPPEKQSRVVPAFQRNPDGSLGEQPRPPAKPAEVFLGGGGLHSTAPDYLRFVRALMAGGTLEGRRILSADSVALMGTNQIGDLTIFPLPSMIPQFITDRAEIPGALDTFGLGFALNSRTDKTARGANTMVWAGVYNTFFWIDREKQVSAVVMTQVLPFLDPGPQRLLEDFDRALYASRTR